MNLTPADLAKNGYTLLDSLGHKDIVPFVKEYMHKRTRFSTFYWISNLIAFGLVVVWFWKDYGVEGFTVDAGIAHFAYGIAFAFGLVPLHEFIHVLAYRSQGARHTSYDANIKKFYFMAIADKFVASRKEFHIVGLAPFVTISAVLLLLLLFTTQLWSFSVLGTLFTHTAFCSGDFGLLSYFDFHKDKEVVSYDDKEEGITYFYQKSL